MRIFVSNCYSEKDQTEQSIPRIRIGFTLVKGKSMVIKFQYENKTSKMNYMGLDY